MPDYGSILLEIVSYALGLVGLVQALLMLASTYENTRFFRSRLRTPVSRAFAPRVQVFMPCKGVESSFADTVHAILDLDYPAYSVTFIVESVHDPAYGQLRQMLARPSKCPARLLVAGQASDCGQKVHNLLTATAQLEEDVEVLAFVDSDTVPDRNWLLRLVGPLKAETTGVVTGYRWFFPQAGDWPSVVLSALNASVTLALGNHGWNLVWGGTWALRVRTFERLIQDGVWRGSLTDDLPISSGVRRLGLRVVFEPGCLVASPVRVSWRGLVEFARRQYLITRVFVPGVWWLALAGTAFAQGIFWGGVVLALCSWRAGHSAAGVSLFLATLFGINIGRALLRQRAVVRRFPRQRAYFRPAARLDLLGFPLLGLGQLFLLLVSGIGRSFTWRTIRYRLRGPHHTEIVFRPEVKGAWPLGVPEEGAKQGVAA